jgi:hypothetical protein
MWRLLKESVEGTAHRRLALPCQDSCGGVATCPAQEHFLVLACSDGAGSAGLSQVGSTLACRRFLELACEELQRAGPQARVDPLQVLEWYREVHLALRAEAEQRGVPLRELACTLLAAVVGEGQALFAQVGDGAMVVRGEQGYAPVFWPQQGEYANSTFFITQPDFEQALQLEGRGRVDEVALFTDGLQWLALHQASREAHGPFFEPLFAALRTAPDPAELVAPLRSFLDSPAVNERTDDDKTLVLAVRVTPAAEETLKAWA